ncbi:MAG: NACHT domain-containing protein [Armatimonadetes bacterium]|nr:NACHT domain-containing protein [Armatimonadota bacterium]
MLYRNVKERKLAELPEDEFRNGLIVELFRRKGLTYYKDTCGPDEEGKDGIFLRKGAWGEWEIIAVQTKKGKLTLAGSKPADNLEVATTQLRTALRTKIYLPGYKLNQLPTKVYLIASETVSKSARAHIVNELTEPSVVILDRDDVIQMVDEVFPEYWFNLHPSRIPYFRGLLKQLVEQSDVIRLAPIEEDSTTAPIADDIYLPLYLTRIFRKIVKRKGVYDDSYEWEEIKDEALLQRPERFIFVLGEAGTGKTTLLRRLAYLLCRHHLNSYEESGKSIPVLLTAREIATEHTSLEILIHRSVQSLSNHEEVFLEPDALRTAHVTLFIDGLDEVGDSAQRTEVVSRVEAFLETHKNARALLTSRDNPVLLDYQRSGHFVHFRVSDISVQQATALIDRLAAGRDPLEGDHVKEIVRRLNEAHGFELTPFLVSIFVATAPVDKTDIPPNITEVFRKYVDLALGGWDKDRGLAQQFEVPAMDAILRGIAQALHSRHDSRLSKADAEAYIAQVLSGIGKPELTEQAVSAIFERSRLLKQEGDSVMFRHLLFQEYFAGRALRNVGEVRDLLADPWWRHPIMFYFGQDTIKHPEILEIAAVSSADLQDAGAYDAGLTIGLALQAAYFLPLERRKEAYLTVVKRLGAGFDRKLREAEKGKYPFSLILARFLEALEAVSCSAVRDVGSGSDLSEGEQFWIIAGLIDCGDIAEAKDLLRRYKPVDDRRLLALSLASHVVWRLRITNSATKRLAKDLVQYLDPRIVHLKGLVLKEFKGLVMEMRQGQLIVIDAPITTPSGQVEMDFGPPARDVSRQRKPGLIRK